MYNLLYPTQKGAEREYDVNVLGVAMWLGCSWGKYNEGCRYNQFHLRSREALVNDWDVTNILLMVK